MKQDKKTSSSVTILQVILPVIGTIIVAYFSYMGLQLQIETPIHATQTAESKKSELEKIFTITPSGNSPVVTPTIIATTPTKSAENIMEIIPFSDNSKNLNPIFGWQPGGSIENDYDLELNPGKLTLIAGAYTDQWEKTTSLPLIIYPMSGNFEVQVQIYCKPIRNYQYAGLGIRSTDNHNSWARIDRGYYDNQVVGVNITQDGQSSYGNQIPFSSDTVYVKIARYKSLVTFSYSANGINWVVVAKDMVAELPQDVEIYLYNFSAQNNSGFITQFKDFSVMKK